MSRSRAFSAMEAAEIRRLYDTGRYSMQTLAAQFNCSVSTIWRVVNRAETYEPDGSERVLQLLDDIEEMLINLSLTIEDMLEDLASIKEDVQFG